MSITNGHLPDYLLIADAAGKWHLTDRHGALLLETVTNPDTLVRLMGEAGASYKIIDPKKHQHEVPERGKGNL